LSAVTFRKTSWAIFAALTLLAAAARAAEVTRVVSALDDDDSFDFNLTASWLHEAKSALIKRESESGAASGIEVLRDLKYAETRDVLNLRADFGILWDVGLHVEAPLVLADSNSLSFDQGVGPTNSTLLRDGILPGYGGPSWGLDAPHNRPFSGASNQVFQSPTRSGFENLGLGITWAVFNQRRDDTKPTWTLGFDAKLDVFKDMRFDPSNPTANEATGLGYHQLIWSTWVSKRFRHFDPYFGAYYMLPIRTNGSIFQDYNPATQTSVNPQQQAGATVGVEEIAWENPRGDQRVTIEARGHAEQHFAGRGYSELWEPLSGSPGCSVAAGAATPCRAGIDQVEVIDPTNPQGNPEASPYPGVSDIDAYSTFGGDLGLNIQVGKYVRFRGLFGLAVDTPHFITDASAGVDTNHNGAVNSFDKSEANPTYRESIDLPGRRFRVEETEIWSLLFEGSIMF
jgi:hypothetical protein